MNLHNKCLVIGAGSIGTRHIRNLKFLYPDLKIGSMSASNRLLTIEEVGADCIYPSIDSALEDGIDFAIIASPATLHLEHTISLVNQNIPVLIEKPLTDSLDNYKKIASLLFKYNNLIQVGYNLRFLKSAIMVKELLNKNMLGEIQLILAQVGQYLPHWRKNSNYKNNVSAQRQLGGGALLELSHELDYLLWLLGSMDNVYCSIRNSNSLQIDVEDCVDAIFQCKNFSVNLHMDFLQHQPSRTCTIVGSFGTLNWDLLNNQVVYTAASRKQEILYNDPNYDKNETYLAEIKHFLLFIQGKAEPIVSLNEALNVMYLIEGMLKSSKLKQLVNLKDLY